MAAKAFPGVLGLSLAALQGGVVGAGKVQTVVGMTLCNRHTAEVTVNLLTRYAGPVDIYTLDTFTIPAKETHVPYGNLSKKFLPAGSQLWASCSVDAVVHFDINCDEDDVES